MSRPRRSFDREFRDGAVRIVRETGQSVAQGMSVQDLVSEGLLHSCLLELDSDVLPSDRPLYKHQETALRKAVDGRNLISGDRDRFRQDRMLSAAPFWRPTPGQASTGRPVPPQATGPPRCLAPRPPVSSLGWPTRDNECRAHAQSIRTRR